MRVNAFEILERLHTDGVSTYYKVQRDRTVYTLRLFHDAETLPDLRLLAAAVTRNAPEDGELNPHALPVGARVESYEVIARRSPDYFGATYRVKRDGRTYAMKICFDRPGELSPQQSSDLLKSIPGRIHAACLFPFPDGFPCFISDDPEAPNS